MNHITFLDGGHVSSSNPVRQSLFTFKDAQEKKDKATAAAERLREIHPGVVSDPISSIDLSPKSYISFIYDK